MTKYWVVGASWGGHVYVLVNIRRSKKRGEWVEYFVVPSKKVMRIASHGGDWPHIRRDKVEKFENDWSTFGKPRAFLI